MPFDCSPEALDIVCDLWQKYALKPITRGWLKWDKDSNFDVGNRGDARLIGACVISMHACAAGLELSSSSSVAEIIKASGFNQVDAFKVVDGYDNLSGDTTSPYYQYGAAVRRRLQERGLLDANA